MIKKILPGGRFRTVLSFLGLCLLAGVVLSYSEQVSSHSSASVDGSVSGGSKVLASLWSVVGRSPEAREGSTTGTLEKMIVQAGSVDMKFDLAKLNGGKVGKGTDTLRFAANPDTFFTILVFNGELRGPLPSTMELVAQNAVVLPAKLNASLPQLVIENRPWGEQYDMVVRDGQTGYVYFNIDGLTLDFNAASRSLSNQSARLRLSDDFAAELRMEPGTVVGDININATMRTVESTVIVDGEVQSEVLPASERPDAGTVPGPDVIVGDLSGLAQFGSQSGTQVGLSVGTDSCNFGTVDLHWIQNPANDHPVIPQNLYRMSGGASNNQTFEQIGQSSLKHAFTALTNNICNLGCNGVGGSNLGSGCSDPYSASLNSSQTGLGSRAWVNPFTGFYPRNDSATPNNSHTGHTHTGTSHRIITEVNDLNTSLNAGATYYAESQYVTPHEYAWCQANPTQCNMNNNVSYRQYSVSGTAAPFSFSPVGSTQRMKYAMAAWTGASITEFRPDPVNDGIGAIGFKVTSLGSGVWHYEYAIYNQNIDRAIASFSIPLPSGATISNYGFHAPPQQPGNAGDGTSGNLGFSNAIWTQTEANGWVTWASETMAQNPNANAVRWGTLYNIRFDSNRPPITTIATLGFLKTGNPINVVVQAPSNGNVACSRRPEGNRCL